jgi:hypothetical protein
MSSMTWARLVLSSATLLYWTWLAPWCHLVGSYHHYSYVQEWSAGSTLHYRAALYRPACLASASVMHERALKTRDPTCVPRAANPFFIDVVPSPSGAVWHMAAQELPSQEGRAQSQGTRGSAGAHLSTEVRYGGAGHVVAPEATSAGRCGHMVAPELTSQEGRARNQGAHGSVGSHLST